MYNKCLLSKLAKSNCSPSRLRDFFWHFYKSNGNHSRPTSAEAAWRRKSLQCASDIRSNLYLVCMFLHPCPSLAPTEQRENQQAKALHAGAAFPSDVRTDVLKYSYLPKSGGKRDPQSIFGGAEWVLARCQSRWEGSSFCTEFWAQTRAKDWGGSMTCFSRLWSPFCSSNDLCQCIGLENPKHPEGWCPPH